MKTQLTALILFISVLSTVEALAETIEIPVSTPSLFVGNLADELNPLKAELMQAAIAKCGGSESGIAAIRNVEVTLKISNLDLRNPGFTGSYPLSGVKAELHCHF